MRHAVLFCRNPLCVEPTELIKLSFTYSMLLYEVQRVPQQGASHHTRARGGDSDSVGLATRGGGIRGAAGW